MGTRPDHRPVKAGHGHGDETNGDGTGLGFLGHFDGSGKRERLGALAPDFKDSFKIFGDAAANFGLAIVARDLGLWKWNSSRCGSDLSQLFLKHHYILTTLRNFSG